MRSAGMTQYSHRLRPESSRLLSTRTGANSYIAKPVGLDRLIEVAEGLVDYWVRLDLGDEVSACHESGPST
jgi:hypothetical protein